MAIEQSSIAVASMVHVGGAMHGHGKKPPSFWIDAWGRQWAVVQSPFALKFKIPCHAALRRHIFHCDNYTCRHCGAKAIDIPENYDGRLTLQTDTFVRGSGWNDVLILDHIITRKAGGRNIVENLQTLCETCNRRKIHKEDKEARAIAQGAPRAQGVGNDA